MDDTKIDGEDFCFRNPRSNGGDTFACSSTT